MKLFHSRDCSYEVETIILIAQTRKQVLSKVKECTQDHRARKGKGKNVDVALSGSKEPFLFLSSPLDKHIHI